MGFYKKQSILKKKKEKAKHYGKDKRLTRKWPAAVREEFLHLCIHGQGAPYRMIWQWGHRTCTPANKS